MLQRPHGSSATSTLLSFTNARKYLDLLPSAVPASMLVEVLGRQ